MVARTLLILQPTCDCRSGGYAEQRHERSSLFRVRRDLWPLGSTLSISTSTAGVTAAAARADTVRLTANLTSRPDVAVPPEKPSSLQQPAGRLQSQHADGGSAGPAEMCGPPDDVAEDTFSNAILGTSKPIRLIF